MICFVLLVTEEQRRSVQLRLISNLLRSKDWITSGLLTISQYRSSYSCNKFPCRSSLACNSARGSFVRILVYPADLMQRVSPELSDQLPSLQSYPQLLRKDCELIDRDDHLEEQFNVFRASVEVNCCLSSSFRCLIVLSKKLVHRNELCSHLSVFPFFPPFNVVEHWLEDNPAFEVLWFTL